MLLQPLLHISILYVSFTSDTCCCALLCKVLLKFMSICNASIVVMSLYFCRLRKILNSITSWKQFSVFQLASQTYPLHKGCLESPKLRVFFFFTFLASPFSSSLYLPFLPPSLISCLYSFFFLSAQAFLALTMQLRLSLNSSKSF